MSISLEFVDSFLKLLDLSLQMINLRLLTAILGHQVSVLQVDSFSLLQLDLKSSELHSDHLDFLLSLFKKSSLSLVLCLKLGEPLELLLVVTVPLFDFVVLIVQLQDLHPQLLVLLSLLLQLHLLVPEGFLEVSHVVTASLESSSCLVLLLDKHVLLHDDLFELASESKALVDVDCQFYLDFLLFCELDVSFHLLNHAVFFLDFGLQISVVLFELGHNEAFSKVMLALVSHQVFANVGGRQSLLKFDGQFLEFFVSLVQFSLDLLDLGLEANVLFLGDVVCNFQVSVLVLNVFPLHFCEELGVISRVRLLLPKDHLSSKLFALHGLDALTAHVLAWTELRITHHNSCLVHPSWHEIV